MYCYSFIWAYEQPCDYKQEHNEDKNICVCVSINDRSRTAHRAGLAGCNNVNNIPSPKNELTSAHQQRSFAFIPACFNHVCWQRIHKKEGLHERACVSQDICCCNCFFCCLSCSEDNPLVHSQARTVRVPGKQLQFEQLRQIYCISIRAQRRLPEVTLKF